MARFAFGDDVKVQRIGATDQVAQQLRTMIADGRLPQGERLPEIPLAEAFGVSRNTLRDGIRILASEGLVTHVLNRGAVVRTTSPEDVSDIYGLRRRLELEGLAAVPAAPGDVRAVALDALDACAGALARGDYGDFVEHELDFHAALVSHLGSPRLDRFFSQIIGELRLLFSDLRSDSEHGRAAEILEMYRWIYASAEAGDVANAQRGLREHLDAYETRLREVAGARLEAKDRDGGPNAARGSG
jgi:DNA-binding GntR family transcriptional regulator